MAGNWIVRPRPNPESRLRLFCFPYAGGGATSFRGWADALGAAVDLCLVELPGRGSRLREPAMDRLDWIVEAAYEGLLPDMQGPFAFFGHSMGALIGFELARVLRRRGHRLPLHLFASGHMAPQIPDGQPFLHALPEPKLVSELRRLNGTPKEVFDHPELMQLLIPIVRADFAANETYHYQPEPPLTCSITAYGGLGDVHVRQEHLTAWKQQTSGSFALRMFPGDHFFFHTSQAEVLGALKRDLVQLSLEISHNPGVTQQVPQ